jgi:hypothetical protein
MAGSAAPVGSALWVSSSLKHDLNPAVAAVPRVPGGQYLVAWGRQNSTTDRDIWVQHVTGDGALEGGALSLALSPQDEFNPAVAGSDTHQRYLVAWTESSGAPGYASDIHGTVVYPDAYDPRGGPPVVNGLFADNASVAAGPNGEFLIVSDDPVIWSTRRIWGRLWGDRLYLPLILK